MNRLILVCFVYLTLYSSISSQVLLTLLKTAQSAIEALQQEIRIRMEQKRQLNDILNQSSLLAIEKLKQASQGPIEQPQQAQQPQPSPALQYRYVRREY